LVETNFASAPLVKGFAGMALSGYCTGRVAQARTAEPDHKVLVRAGAQTRASDADAFFWMPAAARNQCVGGVVHASRPDNTFAACLTCPTAGECSAGYDVRMSLRLRPTGWWVAGTRSNNYALLQRACCYFAKWNHADAL
jgi:hypothetical protein